VRAVRALEVAIAALAEAQRLARARACDVGRLAVVQASGPRPAVENRQRRGDLRGSYGERRLQVGHSPLTPLVHATRREPPDPYQHVDHRHEPTVVERVLRRARDALIEAPFAVRGHVRRERYNEATSEEHLLERVRILRGRGLSPKEIARTLGARPAAIAPLVRRVARETPAEPAAAAPVVGSWVSPGWSSGLIVERRDGWEDVDLGPDGPQGMALALVARADRHDRVVVCGWLVDTFCLGVKNAIGPDVMRRRDLPAFVRMYFTAFPAPALRAPIELAEELVLGGAEFAAALGFSPHPDFAGTRAHLGELADSRAITFGSEGRPLYVAGPYDDPIEITQTLLSSVGSDGFAVAA
jgi:hypothetical protein